MDRFLDDNNIVRKNKINDVLQKANALKERTQKKIESLTPEQYELLTASPATGIKQTKKQILQQVEDLANNNELITSTEQYNDIEQQANISAVERSNNDSLPPSDNLLPPIDPLPIVVEQNLPQQEVIAKSNIVDKIPINEINVSEQDQLKADALLASLNSALLAHPIKEDKTDIADTINAGTINTDTINTDTIDTEVLLTKDNSIDNLKQEEQDIKNNDSNTILQKDDSFISNTNIVNESNQSSSETISETPAISPALAQKKMHPTPTSTAHRLSASQSQLQIQSQSQSQSFNRQITNEARQVKPMDRNVISSRSNLAQNKDNVNNIISRERLNQPQAILLEKQRIAYNELVDLQVEFEIISRMLSRVEERLKPSYSTKIQAIQTQTKEKELRLATIANLLAGR